MYIFHCVVYVKFLYYGILATHYAKFFCILFINGYMCDEGDLLDIYILSFMFFIYIVSFMFFIYIVSFMHYVWTMQ